MAAAADTPNRAAPSAKKSKPWLLIVMIVLVLALVGVGAGWFFAERKAASISEAVEEAAKPRLPAPALYFALEPPFVVNLNDPMHGPRYLQVEVQLMTRDTTVYKNLELHSPAIRARLLMLFAQQTPDSIADRPGKEKLRTDALADVKKLLQAETGNNAVEELLFTSFVTQ